MKALIIVDVQYDFLPGGSLAVPRGYEIIAEINSIIKDYNIVIATKDYHPKDHLSFASQYEDKSPGEAVILNGYEQVLWPDHCVQGTFGSEIAEELKQGMINKIIYKGICRDIDSYSAFFDNKRQSSTELHKYLQEKKIFEIDIVGLATNYCVKYTVLDAIKLGYKVNVIIRACRGIEIIPGDIKKSIEEIKQASALIIE